jgi:hypothetical protein
MTLRGWIMTVSLIVVGALAVAALAFYLLFPPDSFMIIRRPGGGTMTVGRTGVRVEPPPDRYPKNGLDHIGKYLARLLGPSSGFKSLIVATAAGDRACGFWRREGSPTLEAVLSVEWRVEPEREARIRSFFSSRNVQPSQDYLSDNGGVTDSTLNLTYPLTGDLPEVTQAAQVILQQLCEISSTDPLNITYTDR